MYENYWYWDGSEWYYYQQGGMKAKGWVLLADGWYYLDPEQGKLTGTWLQQGDDWYYLNPDGSMATGWLLSQGSWYYLDPRDGRMVKDQVVGEYYIGQNGIWAP